MTSLDDYAQFLTARWDEEEAAAREAIAERDRIKFVDPSDNGPDWCFDANPDTPVPVVSVGPERVIADLAAKRALLDEAMYDHRRLMEQKALPEGDFNMRFLLEVRNDANGVAVAHLATPFRTHPDHPANQEAK